MRLLYTSGSTSNADTHQLHMTKAECSALQELLRSADMGELTELYVDRMTTNKSEAADREEVRGLLDQYRTLVLAHARAMVILSNG